jgi:plasmid maintenance system antidote protein VapI
MREPHMNKNGLPAFHPGEFLREILSEMGISQAQFARAMGKRLKAVSELSPA